MKQVRKVKTLPKLPGVGSFQYTLIRVAAYARVSTDKAEQRTSFEGQISYYTKLIEDNPAWKFAGMYSDEGISGLGTVKREGFNSLIEDAMSGKIDETVANSIQWNMGKSLWVYKPVFYYTNRLCAEQVSSSPLLSASFPVSVNDTITRLIRFLYHFRKTRAVRGCRCQSVLF